MTGIYIRVTLDGNSPKYEVMHDGAKLNDIAFTDLVDFGVAFMDLLSEKRPEYEISVAGRDIRLSWVDLHRALEQFAGAIRFERLTM